MKIIIVAGARPNFMKIASIIHAIDKGVNNLSYKLIHTGQHYDKLLSDNFFEDLRLPTPDYNLNVRSGSHAQQCAEIMIAFEKVLLAENPDLVLVVGDVNSTMACTVTAKKLNIKVAHVEAGIRSFDLEMPEEINRMITDSIADYFFTTTEIANNNLLQHGAKPEQIHLVGNTMIDTLISNLDRLIKPDIDDEVLNSQYAVLTLHRPSNVDQEEDLLKDIRTICIEVAPHKVIFPVHPRTQNKLKGVTLPDNLLMTPPMRYLEFIHLIKHAWVVITDSGGIQEETTYLKVPCLTLRDNTERPETIEQGTNVLASLKNSTFKDNISKIKTNQFKTSSKIPLWDGNTGDRIVQTLNSINES